MKNKMYPIGKGKYSVMATGYNLPAIVEIGVDCNGGNVELTRKYLASKGYTSIVIVIRKK